MTTETAICSFPINCTHHMTSKSVKEKNIYIHRHTAAILYLVLLTYFEIVVLIQILEFIYLFYFE